MIDEPCPPSSKGLAPATDLTLVQHYSLGSWHVVLSLFSSLTEGSPPDMVLLQDPPSSKGFRLSFLGFKAFAPPVARPRVACYISLNFLRTITVLPFFPPETDDFRMLDVFTPQGCYGTNSPRFTIGNAYARPLPPFPHSVSPVSFLLELNHPYSVAGDFNFTMQQPTPLGSSPQRRKENPPPTSTAPQT